MPEPLSTTLGICCLSYGALTAYAQSGSAVSREAVAARQYASRIVADAGKSQTLFGPKNLLIDQLHCLAAEWLGNNFENVDSQSLDPVVIKRAEDIIRTLPDGFRLPECSVEPDGSISLDWIASRNRMFSLSVGRSDRLAFAWLDGSNRGHGVTRLDGPSLPTQLLSEIRTRVIVNYAAFRAA